jgi:hypothetical protein
MTRTRFPAAASLAAILVCAAAPAYAQQARIDDIQVSHEGEAVSILVMLSTQPSAAAARAIGGDLVVEIDGPKLAQLVLSPPAGSLVRRVEASGNRLRLSGAAFADASTVIYRNAVLIETRLAEPEMQGPSLMTADAPQPFPRLESGIALASIDDARCEAAAAEYGKDPWSLPALGDHALCLLDAGKIEEGKDRLDQLAAFAPDDPRVAVGRAALQAQAASSLETGPIDGASTTFVSTSADATIAALSAGGGN